MSGSWMGGSGFGGDEDDPPFQYDSQTAGQAEGRVAQISGTLVPTFAEVKDPADHLDYALDLDEQLTTGEIVATVDLVVIARIDGTVSSGPDVDLDVRSAFAVQRTAVVWLTDGVPGTRYRLSVQVTTSRGRQIRRYAIVAVKDR